MTIPTEHSGGWAASQLDAHEYPALCRLPLSDADLQALRKQGFVSTEIRGNRPVFRLRFRRQDRQCVRCLASQEVAVAVRAELTRLQAPVRQRRQLAALARAAARTIRQTKRSIEPVLASRGCHFHGLEVRRIRKRSNCQSIEPLIKEEVS